MSEIGKDYRLDKPASDIYDTPTRSSSRPSESVVSWTQGLPFGRTEGLVRAPRLLIPDRCLAQHRIRLQNAVIQAMINNALEPNVQFDVICPDHRRFSCDARPLMTGTYAIELLGDDIRDAHDDEIFYPDPTGDEYGSTRSYIGRAFDNGATWRPFSAYQERLQERTATN